MMEQPTTAEIARDWELWGEYADPYGVVSREDWEGMAMCDREALIVETFGPDAEDAEGEDARDAAAAVAALEEWEREGRPTVSLEELSAELGL